PGEHQAPQRRPAEQIGTFHDVEPLERGQLGKRPFHGVSLLRPSGSSRAGGAGGPAFSESRRDDQYDKYLAWRKSPELGRMAAAGSPGEAAALGREREAGRGREQGGSGRAQQPGTERRVRRGHA